ncbi:hypothetical protein GWI33_016191 [Rhynchophorus ferrugineus]|uniref:Uncharacterized protein n=1 Tax=Rhynchophorus ferrugineus TaxID=354439 RepID=A0A834I0L9_RHYFE|nr:hypothetical protein GWI33_016191 [Rhynchophorus ferrugineus]
MCFTANFLFTNKSVHKPPWFQVAEDVDLTTRWNVCGNRTAFLHSRNDDISIVRKHRRAHDLLYEHNERKLRTENAARDLALAVGAGVEEYWRAGADELGKWSGRWNKQVPHITWYRRRWFPNNFYSIDL